MDDRTLAALGVTQNAQPAGAADLQPAPSNDSNGNSSPDSGGGVGIVLLIIGGIVFLVWRAASKKPRANTPQPVQRVAPNPTPRYIQNRPQVPVASPRRPLDLEIGSSRHVRTAEERQQEAARAWVSVARPVVVANYQLPGGLIYVGTQLARQDGLGADNCLINPQLSVTAGARNDDGAGMPYYPSYAFLDPASRAAYLNWLALGRNDPGAYIGYVFLYFYGLERRLFLDDSRTEAETLVAEVQRLRTIYGQNHSFDRYSGAFLDAAALLLGRTMDGFELDLGRTTYEIPFGLRADIGRSIASGTGLTADQVLGWYCAHPDRQVPWTVTKRCPEELRSLFTQRFAKQFPAGLKVAAPKRRLTATYQAASSTFAVALHGPFEQWPDISGLTAPLNVARPLIDSCVESLAAYSRQLGRTPEKQSALETALAIPAELSGSSALGPLKELKEYCDTRIKDHAALLSVADLGKAAGIVADEGAKYGKTSLVSLVRALARCGFGMEPDPRSPSSKLDATDMVALFRSSDAEEPPSQSSPYLAAMVMIDLGALIATADGNFDAAELSAIQGELMKNSELTMSEKIRLLARTAYRTKKPATTRMFAKLSDGSIDERRRIARFAVSIAGADGRLQIEEVRLLERLYRTLKLPEAELYSDLQGFGASVSDLPRPVANAQRDMDAQPSKGTVIALDTARLARTRAETAEVGNLLGKIFAEDEPHAAMDEVAVPLTASSSDAAPKFDGLDVRYAAILAALSQRKSIPAADFAELARSRNLLPDGTIEAINDWAYTKFDQPVLEEGDPIGIDQSLLDQVRSEAA